MTDETPGTPNLVCVADQHCGCKLGLYPYGIDSKLDEGVGYIPSEAVQKVTWGWWCEFWLEFVPSIVGDEVYDICNVGDALDGVHHGSVHQFTHNRADQNRVARQCWEMPLEMCHARGGKYYHIRGTEAHSGKSAENEELVAESLKAIPDPETGQFSRWQLRKKVGHGIVQLAHHVGCTSVTAYETSAPHRELVDAYTDAALWNYRPPDIVVRGHRHRYIATELPTSRRLAECARSIVLPGWQAKTPFGWKIDRHKPPMFGGVVIRQHPDGILYHRPFIRTIMPPEPE